MSAMSTDKVKDLLRGEPGTSIQLTVQRDGAPEPTLSMAVQRKLVRLPDVTLATLDGNGVGYMKLEGFSEGTAEGCPRDQDDGEREPPVRAGGLKALVLGIRDNPGGFLDAAVSVSQMLVPGAPRSSRRPAASTARAPPSHTARRGRHLDPRTRLVVLVNSNTASAAEIATGVVLRRRRRRGAHLRQGPRPDRRAPPRRRLAWLTVAVLHAVGAVHPGSLVRGRAARGVRLAGPPMPRAATRSRAWAAMARGRRRQQQRQHQHQQHQQERQHEQRPQHGRRRGRQGPPAWRPVSSKPPAPPAVDGRRPAD